MIVVKSLNISKFVCKKLHLLSRQGFEKKSFIMPSLWKGFVNIPFKHHLIFSFIIRILLTIYGIYHDHVSKVKYTDIDYKVFTDASRHIIHGNSPYDRHTYRYSPLIAIFLIPNIILHHSFGKILFSLVDVAVAYLIRLVVKCTLNEFEQYKEHAKKPIIVDTPKAKKQNHMYTKKRRQSNMQTKILTKANMNLKNNVDFNANFAMVVWLYNPLTLAIATRGNCDSIAGLLVLTTLYLLQCKQYYFFAGITHGIAIHFRLYPLIYSLTLYMYLSKFSYYSTEDRRKISVVNSGMIANNEARINNVKTIVKNSVQENNLMTYSRNSNKRKTVFKKEYLLYLIPSFDQLKLVSGCIISLSCLTGLFYYLYGYKFLFETYIFHFIRKDTRHNFSLYFYLQYLTAWVKNIGIWQKVLIIMPQTVLLLVLSVRYGLNKFSLNFSILTQTIVMVIYNGVLTSQYFVWVMAILPLSLWQVKMTKKMGIILLLIWFVAQGVWLLPAYLLEFQGQNTFLFIWIQSVSFFCANIAILGRFIMYFMPIREKSS